MTHSVSSVIDGTMICSFRFVVDVFLGTCGRDIECEVLRSSLVGGDHGRTLAAANLERRAPLPPLRALLLGPPCCPDQEPRGMRAPRL
jgi:hypothetical protein